MRQAAMALAAIQSQRPDAGCYTEILDLNTELLHMAIKKNVMYFSTFLSVAVKVTIHSPA